MWPWRSFFVFLVVGLLVPASAARFTLDVCEAARHQSANDFWNKRFVILTGQLEKRTNDAFDKRLLTVDRVLFGDLPYTHGDQCTVTVSCMFDGYLTGPGKYLLLFQRMDDGKLLLSEDVKLQLGPAVNYLTLPAFDDPIISDVQLVVDTLSIHSDALRWECMASLWPRVTNRPFVRECFLRAMTSQYRETERNYFFTLGAVFREPEKYHPATVLFADQLRRGANPRHPVPSLRTWTITTQEFDLLEEFAAKMPATDPNRAYLRLSRTVAAPPSKPSLTPAAAQRLRDAYASDVWPAAAVVDFPQVEKGVKRCSVTVERVISGEQVLAPGKREILIARGAMLPPAGKYLAFFHWTVDDDGREIACYGQYDLALGSVVSYHPVTTADDAAVDDLRALILFTRDREIAIWQPLRLDTVDVKHHPLLVNFNLRQAAALTAMMEKMVNQAALEVLQHPQGYTLQFVVLADRLFTEPGLGFDQISDAARNWKTSPERRTLFQSLQQRLTPADDNEPYYSRTYVNARLKEFAPIQ